MINIRDIYDYCYCNRTVYFKYIMPVEKEPTPKMAIGQEFHKTAEELLKKRKITKYTKGEECIKTTGKNLYSEKYDMSGTADIILEFEKICIPIEQKFTNNFLSEGNILQLSAYGLIIEEEYGKNVEKGFIEILHSEKLYEINIKENFRKVEEIIKEIKKIIEDEMFPERNGSRKKCSDCEYRRFCNDCE